MGAGTRRPKIFLLNHIHITFVIAFDPVCKKEKRREEATHTQYAAGCWAVPSRPRNSRGHGDDGMVVVVLVVVALLFGRRAAAPIILPGICSESNEGNIGRRAAASEDSERKILKLVLTAKLQYLLIHILVGFYKHMNSNSWPSVYSNNIRFLISISKSWSTNVFFHLVHSTFRTDEFFIAT